MKYFKHILGFILIALGVVGIIRAELGASPMDAFNYFLYTFLSENGIFVTLGTVIFVIGTIVTIMTYVLTKDKTLIVSFFLLLLVGVVVDLWNLVFGLIPEAFLSHMAFRLISAILSFFIICYGLALTLSTGLPTSPYERLLMHIDKNINNLSISKIFIDGTFFVLAIILGLVLNRLFEQVFIMTFVIAFFTGVTAKMFLKIIKRSKKGEVVHETK